MPSFRTIRRRLATPFTLRASRGLALLAALGIASLAHAQLLYNDVDWKESEVPPPPAFSQDRLIPIDMPRYMSLKFGVDPATIKITPDGVVRYVVVATSREGGGFNAFYEGLRCATDEYKAYARFNNGAWESERDPDWKRLSDRTSRYTLALAAQGVCRGRAPRASVSEMVRALKTPVREVE